MATVVKTETSAARNSASSISRSRSRRLRRARKRAGRATDATARSLGFHCYRFMTVIKRQPSGPRVAGMKTAILHIAAAALVAAAPAVAQQRIVKIDGSSTVFPVTEAVAEDFQKAKKRAVHVTVGISGTGGGLKKS